MFTSSVCQQPKMTYSHIAIRQHMKQISSDELIDLERHDLLFIAIRVVTPSEGNNTVFNHKDSVIADSDSVGISAEVLQDPLCAVEGRLAVDDPLLMVELSS